MRLIISLLFTATTVVAKTTTLAVFELGKSGVVRRTTSSSSLVSTTAATSFWNKLHDNTKRRRLACQHPGMTMVPDMFSKPQGGLVVGLAGNGVDLASMPTLSSLLGNGSEADKAGYVGRLDIPGSQSQVLVEKASEAATSVSDFSTYASIMSEKVKSVTQDSTNNLESVLFQVNSEEVAGKTDTIIADALKNLVNSIEEGSTVVLHLVVEEEDGARRRLLMESGIMNGGKEVKQFEAKQSEQRQLAGDDADDDAAEEEQNDGFYGYGYYNDYGEWVTNYRTMFQIQYFNVVLGTCIGLTVILFVAISMMINMPLMSDTLLFGESAKMMGS